MDAADTTADDAFTRLFAAARAGSAAARGDLLARFRDALRTRIRWVMGPVAAAVADSEDFTQQALAEAWRSLPHTQPRDERAFLGWLTQLARHNICDAVSKRHEAAFAEFASSCSDLVPAHSDTPSQAAMESERSTQLLDAMCALEPDHQRVIELRHFEHLSFHAIGERLARSENAAERLHARAMRRLGEVLRAGSTETLNP